MNIIERKNLLPFILVTSLFLLWGLANNMTDTLLAAFRKIMHMSDGETSLIQFAFYGSYFCFALPAALYIQRHSYKAGVLLGLTLYALGALLFLPAAHVESYLFYLVAIYIMAGGCAILETTANPYILSMGTPETATRRLNIAQSFNPIGGICGIVMSKYFILQDISLYSVSGTYSVLGCILLLIMAVMYFAHMPEGRADGGTSALRSTVMRLVRNKAYSFGVVAQFFYLGAQVGVWSFTIRIVMTELGVAESDASTIYLASIVGFCLSRFVYTYLMKWIAPASLLLFGGMASSVCTLIVITGSGLGWGLVCALAGISVFMSLMFPTIYGIALGSITTPDDAKVGASGLIMAILGGALLTPLQGVVSDHVGIHTSYAVPLLCFAVVVAYALKVRK